MKFPLASLSMVYKARTFSLHYVQHYSVSISRITVVSLEYFESFFPVNTSFLERFAEKCSTFHSNAGHCKEDFECSFHSQKYWSHVTKDQL